MFTFRDFYLIVTDVFGEPRYKRDFNKLALVYSLLFELWRIEVSSLCNFDD